MSHPVGYEALIVYNDPGHAPIPMSGSKYADQVRIPVVMVNHACMESIMGHYSAETGKFRPVPSESHLPLHHFVAGMS